MHIDTFYLYVRETVIGNIAACNTRLQAYNIGVIFAFPHF